jgi:hypothetical protein
MPDEYQTSSLAPFGRVVGVQHLTVSGFPNTRTGTRMVSMSVVKHIPLELAMANQNFVSVVVPLSILLGCARSRRLVLKLNGQWLTLHPLRGGLSHLGRRFRLLQHQPLVLPAVLLMFGHQHRQTKFRPLLPTPPARAMEVSSVEYVPAAATPSVSSSPDTPVFPVGLSIHLSEFKESVTFSGFFFLCSPCVHFQACAENA